VCHDTNLRGTCGTDARQPGKQHGRSTRPLFTRTRSARSPNTRVSLGLHPPCMKSR
jgi:hypothetical protein